MMKIGLAANAAFSALTGVVLASRSGSLAPRLGIDRAVLVALGIGLVGFAVVVAATARSGDPTWVRGVVAADLMWVVAAIPLALLRPGGMTDTGGTALMAVTVIVAALAGVQWVGARSVEQG